MKSWKQQKSGNQDAVRPDDASWSGLPSHRHRARHDPAKGQATAPSSRTSLEAASNDSRRNRSGVARATEGVMRYPTETDSLPGNLLPLLQPLILYLRIITINRNSLVLLSRIRMRAMIFDRCFLVNMSAMQFRPRHPVAPVHSRRRPPPDTVFCIPPKLSLKRSKGGPCRSDSAVLNQSSMTFELSGGNRFDTCTIVVLSYVDVKTPSAISDSRSVTASSQLICSTRIVVRPMAVRPINTGPS